MNIQRELPGIQKNVKLASYTTFKIGGPAEYFFEAKTREDLIKAIKTAKKFKMPFFILSGGSNTLVSDKGYKGLVVRFKNSGLTLRRAQGDAEQGQNIKFKNCEIICEAGTPLAELIKESVGNGLSGLEWVAGIPGTIGGAIRGNAGAFGKSMADVVERVELLEINSELRIKSYESKDCRFGYRNSIFKEKNNLIVLSAEVRLKTDDKEKIKESIERYLNYRKEKHPLEFPSAGSVFENPEGHSAAKLIEECGLKGKKIGQAQISEKHANFIINLGQAKAKDVCRLIDLAKEKVKDKFGIILKEEIKFLGFS